MHLAAGDGFITMADATRPGGAKQIYTFGFSDVTGKQPSEIVNAGLAAANYPAPTIHLKEGQEFYLSLTNVGMILRPDLFDPHSVHFHGFPQAASVFDGVPESSATINMGSTFTYYYNIVDGLPARTCTTATSRRPSTSRWAWSASSTSTRARTSWPRARRSAASRTTPDSATSTTTATAARRSTSSTRSSSARSTRTSTTSTSRSSRCRSRRWTTTTRCLNGRGYPDTVNEGVIHTDVGFGDLPSQPIHAKVEATKGQKVLLRMSNLAVTRFYTLGSTIPMHVVGHNAQLLRGPSPAAGIKGKDLYYDTNSVTLGGGESIDVILDTAAVAPGTYLLYTTNLNYLSNDAEDFGGMMTEITVN